MLNILLGIFESVTDLLLVRVQVLGLGGFAGFQFMGP